MTARRMNDGSWYCDFRYKGQRIRRKSPVNTKRGADKYERQLLDRLLAGLPLDESPQTQEVPAFGAFAQEFMATYAKANNKQSEQLTKQYHLNGHLLPMFGKMRLDEIGVRQLEQFKAKLLDRKLSRKRINNVLGTMSKILNYAVEVNVIDVAPRIKPLKVEPRSMRFLDFDEYAALIAAAEADDPLWLAAILLGGDAGLRRGEIRGIHIEDWNRPRKRIEVQRALWRDQETPTKGWDQRTIPLTRRLDQALRNLLPLKGPYILSIKGGRSLSLETVRWHLPRLCREAGIPPCGWHTLRHTFCSHLAMKGAPARTIQELAGHAQLTTTLRYMHLVEGEKDRAIRLLEDTPDPSPADPPGRGPHGQGPDKPASESGHYVGIEPKTRPKKGPDS